MPKEKNKSAIDKPITINFLASNQIENTNFGKVIKWALTIGKVLIFVTFAIVIGCFIYRISLDQEIEVLKDEIEKNIEGINLNSDIENKIRRTQDKLDSIQLIVDESRDFNLALRKLEQSMPITSYLKELSLSGSGIDIKGISENELVFATFLSTLKKQSEFSQISVSEIKSGGVENPEVEYSINIKIAGKK